MDYVIVSALSVAVTLLLSYLLYIKPIKKKRDDLEGSLLMVNIMVKGIMKGLESKEKDMDRLRQQKEALEKELLEQVGNQTEKRDAES
nr:MAG TPA: PilA, PilC, PilN, PilO, PilM, pilus, ring, membrane channel [Caudoviricetes sp.]